MTEDPSIEEIKAINDASNEYDVAALDECWRDLDKIEAETESKKSAYMTFCKEQKKRENDRIKRLKEEFGVPQKYTKKVRKMQAYVKKAMKLREETEDEDIDDVDMIFRETIDMSELMPGFEHTSEDEASSF